MKLLFLLLFVGCASQIPVADTQYRKDLLISVNGKEYRGMGVAPTAPIYKIHIKSHAKIDYLAIETCHRSQSLEEPYHRPRIIKKRKEYSFDYVPVGLEKDCGISFTVYSKRGENSWGYIEFESTEYDLGARLECNGIVAKGNGVSACHSKSGLIQRISFDRTVKVIEDPLCGLRAGKDTTWQFDQPLGAKVCVFMDKEKKFHKLVMYGYNGVILQED